MFFFLKRKPIIMIVIHVSVCIALLDIQNNIHRTECKVNFAGFLKFTSFFRRCLPDDLCHPETKRSCTPYIKG